LLRLNKRLFRGGAIRRGETMRETDDLASRVDALLTAAYEAEGYVTHTPQGLRRDTRARNEAVLAAFLGHTATNKIDKAKAALTRGELYRAVFPRGPGADGNLDVLTEDEKLAYERLKSQCWAVTKPGPGGWLQQHLAESGSSLVLCRARIMRGADPVPGAYLTDDSTLIIEDAVAGQIESLVRKADQVRQHVDMILSRHPELEPRVRSAMGSGIKRTAAALPLETRTKAVAASGHAA
jgi:hypothetical protein